MHPAEEKFFLLLVTAITVIIVYLIAYAKKDPVPETDSIRTGAILYDELIKTENIHRFRNAARMPKDTFFRILNLLETHGGLRGSIHLCSGEKLMIYITALQGNLHSIIIFIALLNIFTFYFHI